MLPVTRDRVIITVIVKRLSGDVRDRTEWSRSSGVLPVIRVSSNNNSHSQTSLWGCQGQSGPGRQVCYL